MFKRFVQLAMMVTLMALVACNNPEAAPIAELDPTVTNTAVPTDTAVPPTDTPTTAATDTPAPTDTAVPTDTPEPTETPTKAPTNTPEPTDTAVPTNTAVPVTNTPVAVATNPPAPPAALPVAAPPAGTNLLTNPGFEFGMDGWRKGDRWPIGETMSASVYPNFVRSGATSGRGHLFQYVENVQTGTTYRAGVWLKVWSSDQEDRTKSQNPGDIVGRICISTTGDTATNLPSTNCSGAIRPLDTWQYITVDAVPVRSQIVLILHGFYSGPNKPPHNELLWDDVQLGLSPVAATATPLPLGRPVPPAPVAFNASAMRDNMNNARSMLEQMGGLLDRLYRGSREACSEYDGYYRSLVGSARYDGVPAEWQGVYNEYIFAVENGSNTNQPVFDLCFVDGGGGITDLNYGVARQGINDSLNRLIPAIETANALLSQ